MSICSHYNNIIFNINIIKSVLRGSVIVFCVFFLFLGTGAKAATYYCATCDECQEKINNAAAGDIIYLNDDIFDVTKTCVEFNSKSDIIFDCSDGVGGQYVIDGIGPRYYYDGYSTIYGSKYNGIYIYNSNNITIKNCYITDFQTGILINNSDNNVFFDLILEDNNAVGLDVQFSGNNFLDKITASFNDKGINFNYANYNTLTNSVINNNNGTGLYLYYSDNNQFNSLEVYSNQTNLFLQGVDKSIFSGLVIEKSSDTGIKLLSSGNNIFSNLLLVNNNINNSSYQYGWFFYGSNNNIISTSTIKWNNNKDIYINYSTGNLFYDNSFVSITSIVDNDTNQWSINRIGNHWDDFDDESEGCHDSFNHNGICDDGTTGDINYAIDTDSIDYAPKYISSVSKHYCHTCTDCNNKIASTTPGDVVYLLNDIIDQNGDCFNILNKTDITFDCQGHKINGDNDSIGNGIYLNNGGNSGNITISNCEISGFDNGLYIDNSNNNIIIKNTIKNNNYDVNLSLSTGNIFYNNSFISRNFIAGAINNYWNKQNNGIDITPGNYWDVYDGINDACVDINGDGYCDSAYLVAWAGPSSAADYYPYYLGSYNAYACDSCSDCTAKIAAANIGDVITLTKSIMNVSTSTACIMFNNKQGVTFDCNGYAIDSINVSYGVYQGYGIYVLGSNTNDNNTIKNCYVTNFQYGIYINNSNANVIQNVNTVYNDKGLYFNNADSNIISETKSYYNNIGLYFYNSSSNIVASSEANYNNNGFYLDNSYSNIFDTATSSYNKNNGFYYNYSGGNTVKNSTGITFNPININIVSDGGIANIFYSNHFVSPNKIKDSSSITQWDNGLNSGNWWESYDVDVEGCYDINADNICDAGYIVGSLGTIDNYPIWKASDNNVLHCSTCSDCSLAIKNALYGDKIILDNNIWTASEDCINFDYKEGITFDGSDYFLQALSSSYKGIKIKNYSEDNIIKNIGISNFDYCTYIDLSKNNALLNINCEYNNAGLYLNNSQNNNLTDSNIFYNNYNGLSLYNSSNNIINNIDIINNNIINDSLSGGFKVYNYSNNNIVASTTIKGNNINDVYIDSISAGNAFYNNEFVSNSTITDNAGSIWDNGTYGNWWEAFDGENEGCYDINGDTVCDNGVLSTPIPYEIKVNIYDNYPRYKGSSTIYFCSTCSECNDIINSASYGDIINLTTDISTLYDCIIINKSGITFDCNDYLILGSGNTGIKVIGYDNIIRNCQISNFSNGIDINGSNNIVNNIKSKVAHKHLIINGNYNQISNMEANGGLYGGIYLNSGSYNSFSYIKIRESHAIVVCPVGNNCFYNNFFYLDIQYNSTGIYFNYNSDGNIVASSTIKHNGNINGDDNIYICPTCDNNIFYANQLPSSYLIEDKGVNTHWNNWDNVNDVDIKPGNHWENYDVSFEGCDDADNNGYCDSVYNQNGILDNYPIYYGVINNYTCDSCQTCTDAINNALFGETVRLTQDISEISDNCIKFLRTEGIIFDGNGYKFDGLGNGKAVYLYSSIYNKILNIKTYSFFDGIYLDYYSDNNLIKNISSYYNIDNVTSLVYGSGIVLNSSSNNIIINATTTDSEGGVYINNSYNNKITNLFSQSNSRGLIINGIYGDNNIASSSIITANIADVYIGYSGSENNILYHNKLSSKNSIVDYGTGTQWDKGLNIGGNIWEDFNEDSEGCYDINGDNVCDNGSSTNIIILPYQIDDGSNANDGGASVDNYPLRGVNGVKHIYHCDSCETCTLAIASSSPGDTIQLIKDIIGVDNVICIDFNSYSDIIFDCQGYLINGDNATNSIGVFVNGDNNTIKNCYISDFENGVKITGKSNNFDAIYIENCRMGLVLSSSYYNSFFNVHSNYNMLHGIYLDASKNNIFNNCDVSLNAYNGVVVYYYSDNNQFINIISTNNTKCGIRLGDVFMVKDNIIASSTLKWNGIDDVYLNSPSCNTLLYNNDFISSFKIYDYGGQYLYCGGYTQWDNGVIGNHWENFDDESEGCYDVDNNGLCDNNGNLPYVINSSISSSVDNHPKYIGSLTKLYCNSCTDCNNKIASTTPGDIVYLMVDITDQSGHCINLSNAYDIIFDCQGHLIDGDNDATGNGIYLNNGGGPGSITVQNCIVQEFNNGVYVEGSDTNKFINNVIKNNVSNDVVIDFASDANIFYDNDFNSEVNILDNSANTHWDNYDGVNDNAPGNHWDAYDEPAEGCNDISPSDDGYCDAAYIVTSSGSKDYYSKYVGTASQNECSTCAECNSKINNASAGETIYLTSNIINYNNGDCISFGNSNIIFDCQGYTIDGANVAGSSGIIISSQNNNIIKNCRITNFDYGISFNNADFNYIHHSEIINNNSYGLYLYNGSDFNKIDELVINRNVEKGIYMYTSNNNIATSSEIRFNKINVSINSLSSNNVFYNNHFISKYKIVDNGNGTSWDNGINLGNWWENFDVTNEGCNDINGDNICDNGNISTPLKYEVETGVYDNYPIYKGLNFNLQNKTCNSCLSCSNLIKNSYYGERIVLTKDIGAVGDCIDFYYNEGITFDCNGYYIMGNGGSYDGIYILGNGEEDNSITNCYLDNFGNSSIHVKYSSNNTFNNNYIQNSGKFLLEYSDNNYIKDLQIMYGKGLELSFCDNNILTNIQSNNNINDVGINFYYSHNNIIIDATTTFNNIGIKIIGHNNVLDSNSINIVKNNTIGINIICQYSSSLATNTIINTSIKRNNDKDVYITSSCDTINRIVNKFYNDEFISNDAIFDYGETSLWDNSFNIGNWWEAFDTDEEGCYDADSNGICDNGAVPPGTATTSYEVKPGVYDHYPKYKGPGFNTVVTCDSCQSCTDAIQNSYYGTKVQLTQDIYGSGAGACIDFGNARGIIFSCEDSIDNSRFNIVGDESNDSFGVSINVSGTSSNAIEFCNFKYFDTGLYINNAYGNIIASSSYLSNNLGVKLYFANNNRLYNLDVSYNKNGISLISSNNNILSGIKAVYDYNDTSCIGTGDGILLDINSNNNIITTSTIKYYPTTINVQGFSNSFYKNYFVSYRTINDIGNGTVWNGNYWEACKDNNGDGKCDGGYWKDANAFYDGGSNIITCFSCNDCNEKIKQAKFGDIIVLNQDIVNNGGNCLRFVRKEGLWFAGSGCIGNCVIDGTGNGFGVYMCGGGNNLISNINDIFDFDYGIYLEKTASNTLEDIHLEYNNYDGIYVENDDTNLFQLLSLTNNYGNGIYLHYSNYNVISNTLLNNNNKNLNVNYSDNNKIFYSTSTNSFYGLYLDGSDNNLIASSTLKNNLTQDIYINWSSNNNIFYANELFANNNIQESSNAFWNRREVTIDVVPGNHWETYDEPAEGCVDLVPPYGYCDNVYVINSFYAPDNYPIKPSHMPDDFNITVAKVGYSPITHSSSTCKVVLVWENNHDADEYIIYRSIDGGLTYTELTRVSWNVSFYVDENSTDIAASIAGGYGFSYYIEARNGPYYKSSTCDRFNDLGTVINPHCAEDNGSTTITLYPTICSVDLNATSTDCIAVGLNWNDVTPTNNYYIVRSDDGGLTYEYSCSSSTGPFFAEYCGATTTVIDINNINHPNGTVYYFQDFSATTTQDFYYQVRNCVGTTPCYYLNKCQPTAIGPRDNCYVESNIVKINPCQFPAPKWIEVGP